MIFVSKIEANVSTLMFIKSRIAVIWFSILPSNKRIRLLEAMLQKINYAPGVYSEHCQASKMARFAQIVNGFYQLSIFTKHPILDVWQSSEYVSALVLKWFIRRALMYLETPLDNRVMIWYLGRLVPTLFFL